MNAWDVFDYKWPWGQHPAVIVSNRIRVELKLQVVVLSCRSLQPGERRTPKLNEAVLDIEDGLNWPTLCRCDLLWTVEKSLLKNHRGSVSAERRRDIARKVIQGLAFADL